MVSPNTCNYMWKLNYYRLRSANNYYFLNNPIVSASVFCDGPLNKQNDRFSRNLAGILMLVYITNDLEIKFSYCIVRHLILTICRLMLSFLLQSQKFVI